MQSRKWRLTIRVTTLLVTTVLMLGFAGPVSYALQDDTPTTVTSAAQLLDKDRPLDGRYISASAVPDMLRAVTTREFLSTYHYIPLEGFGNELLVRTDQLRYLFPYDYNPETGFSVQGPVLYQGKVIALKNQVGADQIVEQLASAGVAVDKDKVLILSQGEVPSTFRPIVPVIPALAWLWLAALVGLVQILRGRVRPRHLARSTVPTAR